LASDWKPTGLVGVPDETVSLTPQPYTTTSRTCRAEPAKATVKLLVMFDLALIVTDVDEGGEEIGREEPLEHLAIPLH
jgi:hypothetical protein